MNNDEILKALQVHKQLLIDDLELITKLFEAIIRLINNKEEKPHE